MVRGGEAGGYQTGLNLAARCEGRKVVIPAQAGIQNCLMDNPVNLDPGLAPGDESVCITLPGDHFSTALASAAAISASASFCKRNCWVTAFDAAFLTAST